MTPTPALRPLATFGADRRSFLLRALGTAVGASGALAGCGGGGGGTTSAPPAAVSPAPAAVAAAPTTPEQDVLNFALNLQYLGAQFYAFASAGAGVAGALLTGTGAAGVATGARAVAFADPVVAEFATEIAADKLSHLTTLRDVLGTAAVAQPRIDLSAGAGGAFSMTARAAGVATQGEAFDPYANDDTFLLAASMFEDAVAAAHRATLPLLAASPAGLEVQTSAAASGAYHAGTIRAALQASAVERPQIQAAVTALARAQTALDGGQGGGDVVVQAEVVTDVPDGDGQAILFSRSAQRALRLLYARPGASSGGFFPDGLNGAIRTSA